MAHSNRFPPPKPRNEGYDPRGKRPRDGGNVGGRPSFFQRPPNSSNHQRDGNGRRKPYNDGPGPPTSSRYNKGGHSPPNYNYRNDAPPQQKTFNNPHSRNKGEAPDPYGGFLEPSRNHQSLFRNGISHPSPSNSNRSYPRKYEQFQENRIPHHPPSNSNCDNNLNVNRLNTSRDKPSHRNEAIHQSFSDANHGDPSGGHTPQDYQVPSYYLTGDSHPSEMDLPNHELASSYPVPVAHKHPAHRSTPLNPDIPLPNRPSHSAPAPSNSMNLRKALAPISSPVPSFTQFNEPTHSYPLSKNYPPQSRPCSAPNSNQTGHRTMAPSKSTPYHNLLTPPHSNSSSPQPPSSNSRSSYAPSSNHTKLDLLLNKMSNDIPYNEVVDILNRPSLILHLGDLLKFNRGEIQNELAADLVSYLKLLDCRPWGREHYIISRYDRVLFFKNLCSKKYTLSMPTPASRYSFFMHFVPFLYFISHPSLHQVAPKNFSEIFYSTILTALPDLMETFLSMTQMCLESGQLSYAKNSPILLISFAQLFGPLLQLLEILSRMHPALMLRIGTVENFQRLHSLINVWDQKAQAKKLETLETPNAIQAMKIYFGIIEKMIKT